ncbi:hypothetical protein BDZ94DRAFT_771559 [Collybia nuda]|uniref:Uncharacterized protein n=1 Tax=Collybia nuda TaxID=64659 RepID=A0A9P6CH64_9AGAR|nr:hypothetical protein BDZ94DRAFT_771559 [Collybia nuda]
MSSITAQHNNILKTILVDTAFLLLSSLSPCLQTLLTIMLSTLARILIQFWVSLGPTNQPNCAPQHGQKKNGRVLHF